jgi:hypothetical protein
MKFDLKSRQSHSGKQARRESVPGKVLGDMASPVKLSHVVRWTKRVPPNRIWYVKVVGNFVAMRLHDDAKRGADS